MFFKSWYIVNVCIYMNAYFNGENIVSWDVIAYHHKHNSIVLRISNLLQLKRNKIGVGEKS